MENTYELFLKCRESYTHNEISKMIDVNNNTVKRWEELKSVPNFYHFDLLKILNIPIDYSKFDYKDKDQFFTKKSTSIECLEILKEKLIELNIDINNYTFIEPSAGDGSFYDELPEDKRIGIDIEPRRDGVIESDFLEWLPDDGNYITIGNPPFGLRGNLALRFINHSAKFSDFTAFILPQIFESSGKGNCMDRVVGLNLIHSQKIDSSFYYPNGDEISVNVIFQIWSKHHKIHTESYDVSKYIKIYSVSDGGSPSTTRNRKMWYNCDLYLPTTCFKDNMMVYDNFDELPQKRGYGIIFLNDKDRLIELFNKTNWLDYSFTSTNGAYNLRFDLIEKVLIDNGYKN